MGKNGTLAAVAGLILLPMIVGTLLFQNQLLWRHSYKFINNYFQFAKLSSFYSSINNNSSSSKSAKLTDGNHSFPLLIDKAELSDNDFNTALPANRTPIIFYWMNVVMHGSAFDDLPEVYYSEHPQLGCSGVGRCYFTNDRNDLERAEFVVFGFPTWITSFEMPPQTFKRPSSQLWIFFTNEAPSHTYHWDWTLSRGMEKKLVGFKDYFNWTMTYRLDSDVSAAYGRIEARKAPDYTRNYNRFKKNKTTALFMASYCGNRMSHRDEYLKELQKHGLEVEVLGRCEGKKSPLHSDPACVRTTYWSTLDECTQKIGQRYKFYLAFENSYCKDYITEKFYRAASTDTIPVVLNSADMPRMAPPHSYIDARDFKNPHDLAEFLKKVGSDEKLYNSYFEWKPWYDVVHTMEGKEYKKSLCRLCAHAHKYLANPTPAVVEDIDRWWTGEANCTEGPTHWS